MELVVFVALISLGVIFLWGLLAPRSQWRALISWSYRNPHFDEPTGSAYLIYRAIAAIGVISLTFGAIASYQTWLSRQPVPPKPPTQVELMWGKPAPVVLNKVITGTTEVPTGLVDQPILGFQVVDGEHRQPAYLFGLKYFKAKGATTKNGLIGGLPAAGLVALDTADLVVKVAGDSRCFPHSVVVRETEKTVEIGVFYGQKNPADGSNKDNLASCRTVSSPNNVPTLIPIKLQSPVDKRAVVDLSGEPIFEVEDLTASK